MARVPTAFPDVRLIAAVADEEALSLLKQGSAAWNEQRKLGKFRGADLGGAGSVTNRSHGSNSDAGPTIAG